MPDTGAPTYTWFPDASAPMVPFENLFQEMAESINTWAAGLRKTHYVADLDALAAIGSPIEGDLAFCDEGNFYLAYSDGIWLQQSIATFASTSARDTAFGKASAAYRVSGARARVLGNTYQWFATGDGATIAGWFPLLGGTTPDFSVVASTTQSFSSGTWAILNGAFGAAPERNRGFTSWTGGVLKIEQPGLYDLFCQFSTPTFAPASRIGAQFNRNSATVGTNVLARALDYGTNTASVRRRVRLNAGDDIRAWGLQISGTNQNNDASDALTNMQVSYLGPA